MRMLCAVLVILVAGGARASATEDPRKLEAEFWALCEGAERILAEMKSIRLAFAESSDKKSAIARWESLTLEYGKFNERQQDLRHLYGATMKAGLFVSVAIDFSKAKKGASPDRPDSGPAYQRLDAADKMRSRAARIASAFGDEYSSFPPMRDAYLDRRSDLGRLALAAAAAAALFVGAGLYVFYGTAPPAPVTPPAPAFPKTVAGNFDLVRRLGQGSLGEVYEAVDRTLARRTALKRLRTELLQDPRELERLLSEARVLAGFKHPNMVAIYGVERDAGQVYLALEYVDGGTLQDRLNRERRLSWTESLRILAAVAAAVDYAHARKVVHRDLKPANIMLSTTGEVKVMDFSIAYRAAESVSRLTRAPSWGTPPYMAPEQELGGVSAAVDVYALAVCFYEMLTGELPFIGPNFLAQKREAAWLPPSRLTPTLPPGVDALFGIALAPEASRRFSSAAALVEACRLLTP